MPSRSRKEPLLNTSAPPPEETGGPYAEEGQTVIPLVGVAKDARTQTFFLGFLALIAAGFVIFILREMLLAVVVAVVFSLLFKPLMQFLRDKGFPLWLCVLIVLLCVVGIFALLGLILFTGVESVVEAAPRYQERMNQLVRDASALIQSTARNIGRGGEDLNLADELQFASVAAFLAGSVGSVLDFLENMFLIILFLVFLLSGSEEFQGKIARALSSENSRRVSGVLTQINTQVRRYIVMKTLINIGVGILTTVILLAFGVDFALLIGLLTFFLNYIPNFGALIATVLPMAVIILQFESFGLMALITGLLIVAHNLIGNLLEPKLLGKSLRLSPLLVLGALIFWGWMWGILGAVLAVPITSIIKIICQNVEPLRPVAVLMSDTVEE
jgi:AI-2 transport protein TqsA